jgi:hypothetical protein
MRFATAIFAGLVAVAYAQDSSATTAQPATTVSVDPVQASIMACLDNCSPGDVNCQAKCVPVPNPSEEMVSANNECEGNCPKGNGTEADVEAYISCRAGCYASYYFTTDGAPAGATGGSGSSPTNTASGSDSTGDSEASGTGSAEGSEESGSGGDGGDSGAGAMGVSSAALGLVAFLAAFVAL